MHLTLLVLLRICLLQLFSYLVEAGDIEGFLTISSTQENISQFVMILQLGPQLFNHILPALTIKLWLESLQNWYHFHSKEPLG